MPVFFISHGGGPWPWLAGQAGRYQALTEALQGIPPRLGSLPRGILMLSAHWEESEFSVMSAAMPGMIYDYHGFPEHTYQLSYPAKGDPDLAARILSLLNAAGIGGRADAGRGFDHGAFVPLAVMYPQAEIPVVQVSLRDDYDPEAHLRLGRVLAPLREAGVLIIGSGLSYHNLRRMGPEASQPSREFDGWLHETLSAEDGAWRSKRLREWEKAPQARFAHPHEDHLLPLMVAVGAAETERVTRIHHENDFFGHVTVSSYRLG